MKTRLWIALTVLASLAASPAAFAFSMIDQDEAAVTANTLKDYNGDGKPDGDVVLVSLFRSEKQKGIRTTYTMKIDQFLTDWNSNLKDQYQVGDLFTLNGTPMNPYASLVKDVSGRQYVMFLRKSDAGHPIINSMKIAPVENRVDATGQTQRVLLNPWKKVVTTGTGAPLAQEARRPGGPSIEQEPLDAFSSRLHSR